MRKRPLEELMQGAVGMAIGAVLGAGITYSVCKDHSPYGTKTSLPDRFYGRQVSLDELHPTLLKAYITGYATEDIILEVLDGKVLNIEPVAPSSR